MSKTKQTKADMIREMMKKHPGIKAMTIVKDLAAKGIKVYPNQVYILMKKKRTSKSSPMKVSSASSKHIGSSHAGIDAIISLKNLAREFGGMHNLKQYVDVLAD